MAAALTSALGPPVYPRCIPLAAPPPPPGGLTVKWWKSGNPVTGFPDYDNPVGLTYKGSTTWGEGGAAW